MQVYGATVRSFDQAAAYVAFLIDSLHFLQLPCLAALITGQQSPTGETCDVII